MNAEPFGDSLFRCLAIGCFGMAVLLLGVEGSGMGGTPKPDDLPTTLYQTAKPTRSKLVRAVDSQYHLLVDLSDRRVYLYEGKKQKKSYPVSIGQPGWETPTGSFKVTRMDEHPVWQQPITGVIVHPGMANPLGDRWIGFWTDGSSYIGFHGTPDEAQVGLAISHGCLRMRNSDIRQIYDLVGIGTPVKVQK